MRRTHFRAFAGSVQFLTCYLYRMSVLWIARQAALDEWLDGSLRVLGAWVIIAACPQNGSSISSSCTPACLSESIHDILSKERQEFVNTCGLQQKLRKPSVTLQPCCFSLVTGNLPVSSDSSEVGGWMRPFLEIYSQQNIPLWGRTLANLS